MDWEEEYESLKSGKAASTSKRSTASSSRQPRPADSDDDTAPTRPSRARNAEGIDTDVPVPGDVSDETPLERLIRHWINERNAPEILPAQEDLLSGILDHIRRQSDAVHLLRGDPSTSEDEHMRITLVQTEVERVKFIVRSYVCTRIYKIEKYARYIVSNAEIQTRLTAAERSLASRHAESTDRHLYMSVLQSLPESQSHLDDIPIFMPSIITKPNKDRPVFVHARTNCPPVRLPNGVALEMPRGHISIVPYSVVEHLVERGEAELI